MIYVKDGDTFRTAKVEDVVKELEWKWVLDDCQRSTSGVGEYEIDTDDTGRFWLWIDGVPSHAKYVSADFAKDAANANHRKQVVKYLKGLP